MGFAKPFRLVYVQLMSGASDDYHAFLTQGRPASVRLTVTGKDGAATVRTIALADKSGPQRFTIGVSGVTRLRFEIESSYGATPRTRVELAELEFQGR